MADLPSPSETARVGTMLMWSPVAIIVVFAAITGLATYLGASDDAVAVLVMVYLMALVAGFVLFFVGFLIVHGAGRGEPEE